MGKQKGFAFKLLVGKRFYCPKSQQWVEITADDETKSTQGKDGQGRTYWDVPCQYCGGVHRFWRTCNNHRIGQGAPVKI